MTAEMEYLMHLFACGARGNKPSAPKKDIDWEKLVLLAYEQSITYTVGAAIKKGGTGCPETIVSRLRGSVIVASLRNEEKKTKIIAILSELEAEGISALVLKGYDVARYYAEPECRVSADTDVLISPQDEKRAIACFKRNGFKVTPRNADTHHAVCTRDDIGLIELHVSLWEEMCEDVMFNNLGIAAASLEPPQRLETEQGSFFVLGAADALVFVTLHMIKHFVVSGISLRMLMDVALTLANNAKSIDTERYWALLKNLKYDSLMNVMFGIAVKYFGFDSCELPGMGECSDDDIELIVNDLEQGGWQGFKEGEERRDGWYFLRREREIRSKGRLAAQLLIAKDVMKDRAYALFPKKKHLIEQYPVLRRFAFLIPAIWFYRLISKGIPTLFSGRAKSRKNISDEKSLADEGRERVEMFRKLNML